MYSSELYVSMEQGTESLRESPSHIEENRCVICHDCLRSRLDDLEVSNPAYIQRHLANQKNQDLEMADTDTQLISWKDMQYPFGCWIYGFPDMGVDRKYWSLSMAELYDAGLRFSGRSQFGQQEVDLFLSRFGSDAKNTAIPPGFVMHVTSAFVVPDKEFAQQFARARAVVFDVSICLLNADHRLQ